MFKNFVKISIFVAVFPALACGAQSTAGRSSVNHSSANNSDSTSSASIRRSATSVIARNAVRDAANSNSGNMNRSASSRTTVNRAVSRTAINSMPAVSRSLGMKNTTARTAKNPTTVRSGARIYNSNVSRAAKSRATAVFNDISKIGGGYAGCRDSYATCMDQFCANANDTYRRCFCSDKFVDYRNLADSLDQAIDMLADFQNSNLDAVDKTADEVAAMYSASAGEAAIKRDTSASQKMLNNISEILSGKKSYSRPTPSKSSSQSLGVLDLSGLFSSSSSSSDDPFGSESSLFDSVSLFGNGSNYTDMSSMEGTELYDAANRQCSAITKEECSGDAVFNLARSAYSIMITQDCNLYEKSINAKKESVQNTVRTAEKYLRDARLEEYRAHNSKDVNDCMDKVETAMRQSTACGPNYEKCMDYTGRYINNTTGEPIYSKALFDLNNLIVLDGSADVLSGENRNFDKFLDGRKMFAEQALDGCRSIADDVWTEFKRSALIQIAQAQDAKIQEVKDSCVETIGTCYNKQTGDLNELADDEINEKTGARSAIAAHNMCRDQVLACSALYGDPGACVYDDKTKTIKQKENSSGTCGLNSLLAYVDTVDSVRVQKGCETALRKYADELCADDSDSKHKLTNLMDTQKDIYCGVDLLEADAVTGRAAVRNKVMRARAGAAKASVGANNTDESAQQLSNPTQDNKRGLDTSLNARVVDVDNMVKNIVNDIAQRLDNMLAAKCAEYGGYWFSADHLRDNVNNTVSNATTSEPIKEFYNAIYNGTRDVSWGRCVENTVASRCEAQNDETATVYARYDEERGICALTNDWYKRACEEWLGGEYSNGTCRVARSKYDNNTSNGNGNKPVVHVTVAEAQTNVATVQNNEK